MASAADPCRDLLATGTLHRGTSFAAAIDVIEAGAALEGAIAADTQPTMQAQLTVTAQWLRAASVHYAQVGEGGLAQRAQCAAAAADRWAQIPQAPATGSLQVSLQQFQQGTLVPFHGVLRRLADDAAQQGARDSVETFWAVVLIGTSIIGGAWASDRQRTPLARRRHAA